MEETVSPLVRQELARVEANIALCLRCWGSEPRWPARLERPRGRGRILILMERPPRRTLGAERRLGLSSGDATTRRLGERIREAGIPRGEVLVAAAILCRAASRATERLVSPFNCARECAGHVRELVAAAQPRLILPLGGTALRSLRTAFPERRRLAALGYPASLGRTAVSGGVFFHVLAPVSREAHPEPRPGQDWRAVGRLWEWIARGRAEGGPPSFPIDTKRGDVP